MNKISIALLFTSLVGLGGCSVKQLNEFNTGLNDFNAALGQGQFSWQKAGYASKADYDFAQQFPNATPSIVSQLKSNSVTSKAQLEETVTALKNDRYVSGDPTYQDVFNYMKDKKAADAKKIPVLKQKEVRLAEEKAASEKAAAENRKRQAEHAKNYPYTATLLCSFSGQNYITQACFSGSSKYGADTELEIRNGSEYKLYKPYELHQLGNTSGSGLQIPLRNRFEIKAQNSNDTLVLNLVIKNSATGEVVYQKSAGKYGVIRASN